MAKRIFCIFTTLTVGIMLCGCFDKNGADKVYEINKNDYAIIYDRAITGAKESFIETHLTYGASYEHEQALDKNCPKTYCILVDNENALWEIFDEFPDDVDFDTETVIVYCFTCIYNGSRYKIRKINLDGNSMSMEIAHIPPSNPFAKYVSAPIYRIVAIKTSITELRSVNIKEK